MTQKKSEIFKKQNFLGQALDFLPPRKTGLYISHVDCFFFEYHELKSICIFGETFLFASETNRCNRIRKKIK